MLIFDKENAAIASDISARFPEIKHFIVIGSGTPDGFENYESVLAKSSDTTPKTRSRPTDIAYLIYTSGTTARPNGPITAHAGQLGLNPITTAESARRPREPAQPTRTHRLKACVAAASSSRHSSKKTQPDSTVVMQ